MTLLDRVPERAELDGLLAAARDGRGGAAVLAGEPGIGKSALLRYAVAAADGFTVAEVCGVESERELAYAGLHRLLRPFADAQDRLPEPQRNAVDVAFGRVAGPAPDRFLVSLAVLTLLSDLGTAAPVLVICDDAQWLDRASTEVLAFVGRRLLAERVVLLFATHDGGLDDDLVTGLGRTTVTGLPADDAVALLGAADGLDRAVRTRVVEAADGNPLLLGELAADLANGTTTPAQLAGDPLLGGPLPAGRRLASRYRTRFGRLSAATRTFLLVVAADATGDATLIERAAPRVLPGDGLAEVIEEAVGSGLLLAQPETWSAGRFTFRHPAIRSAVYDAAPAPLRRLVHAALGAVTDDPAGAAWHRAAAATGPDEATAGELDRCAEEAGLRGGHVARAAFLAAAARLSPAPADRDRRLVAAVDAALSAGAVAHAEDLLTRLDPADDLARAHRERLTGLLAAATGKPGPVPSLLAAARALRTADPEAARNTLLAAFDTAVRTGEDTREIASAVAGLQSGTSVADLVLTANATLAATGHAEAAPALRAAMAAMREPGNDPSRWCLLGLTGALVLWDEETLGVCAASYAAAARTRGEPHTLRVALGALAAWELWCGRFSAADGHLTEFHETTAALTPGSAPHALAALPAAWRGDEETARATAERYLPGQGPRAAIARVALVVLALGSGRYRDALTHAEPLLADPHWRGVVLADVVEAATRTGDHAVADRALTGLTAAAEASGTPWALGLLARARALRAANDDAERHYADAVDRFSRTPLTTEHARAQLLYGEWLRRRRRRAEAATRLRAAHEMFTSMGAAGFAARAGQELRAAGGSPRDAEVSSLPELTAQEYRIATLVVDGATNQEIATTLYLSVSTVEYHLRKVFRKLGITSRRQLRLVLRS